MANTIVPKQPGAARTSTDVARAPADVERAKSGGDVEAARGAGAAGAVDGNRAAVGAAADGYGPHTGERVVAPAPPPKRAVHPQLQVHGHGHGQAQAPGAVEKQYSDWASNYDVDTASYGWSAPQTLLAHLTAAAPPRSSQRVLDVGVGTGLASIPYLEARAQVTGVDVSQDMLDEAKKKHPDFHHLDRYDIDQPLESAGLKAGTFDVVLSSGVLHFSSDLRKTLDELDRALAPGGTLAFTFIPPQDRKFGENTHLVDVDAVKEHLEDKGFSLVHDEVFVAYHDKGKADDPVRYALVVAKKPGEPVAVPASLDRTASVDRARIAKLAASPLVDGPVGTTWVKDDDPRIAAQSQALIDAVKAQLAAGGDVDAAKLPFPTVTAEGARAGQAGVDALVLLAHPDDESVYTGGTLAALAQNGKSVALGVATDGGGGRGGDGADLKKLRGEELAGALKALGVSSSTVMSFPDIGKYRDAHRSEPLTAGDTLRAWNFDSLVEGFVRQIRTARPKTLLSFDPTRDPNFSLHGHHMATGTAAAVAVALAADPKAFPDQLKQGLKPWAVLEHDVVVPAGSRGRTVDVQIDPQAKRTALRAHASQSFSLERAVKDPGTSETWHTLQAREPTHILENLEAPHRNSTIPLAAGEPALATRLRAGDPEVAPLYHARPIEQVHAETTSRPVARKQITALLDKQMSALGPLSAAQKKNLARLEEDGTGVVVTGQQTGVLGGPLYSLFKALGAVSHAASLSERGIPAVPVFWLASYDSDLKEVQDMKAVGLGDPKTLSLGNKVNDKPVGDQKLGPGATKVLAELETVLTETGAAHAGEAMALARRCFTPDTTFAAGFSKLMFELTKRHGLLILDPSAREFASLAKPVIARELFGETTSKTKIDEANEKLDALGLKPQVHGGADRLNVFFVDDNGKRVFLSRADDGGFTTGGTPSHLSADEARALLEAAPERFTPSALLRPVVEDQVLPTLTYVGGPSEVSYYAQIGGVYDWAGVPMPQVETRPSFAFAKKGDVAALESATGLSIDALLSHEQPLAVIGRAGLPDAVRAAYDRLDAVRAQASDVAAQCEKLGVARDFDALSANAARLKRDVTAALDDVTGQVRAAGLEKCEKGVANARGKIDKLLEQVAASIEKAKADPGFQPPASNFGKIAAELKNLDEQAVRVGRQTRPELVTAFHKLKPGGEPQERTMTIVQLVAELGKDAADAFLPLARPGTPGRTLVTVD